MRRLLAISAALALGACGDGANPLGLDAAPDLDRAAATPGAVYTMTNAADGNAILAFHRAPDGALAAAGEVATGGLGTGAGLGNQGGLALTANGRVLLAVNAGDNTVSVLALRPGGPALLDVVASGGEQPVSVTASGRLVYVLNAGGEGNITGFRLAAGGLEPLEGSTRALSGAATGPAQVGFSPDGRVLVVTEKATNQIVTYQVDGEGLPGEPQAFASAGMTPFGFAFDPRGRLIVSEAFGGAAGASAVSSYAVSPDGTVDVISAAVPTTQTAACWIVVTADGRFAYTTNTGSGSVSGYVVAPDGSLALRDADGRTGETGDGSSPIDMALSRDGRFLYTLNAGTGTISAFHARADGGLVPLGETTGLPAGSNGLAAR